MSLDDRSAMYNDREDHIFCETGRMVPSEMRREGMPEIAIVGELTDNEGPLTDKLLDVPPGGECVLYFDCPGGSPYSGLSLMSLILLRGLRATAIVTGECSSAALWPFAACQRRLVTPFTFLLFHPIKWQSDEHVQMTEALEWARHFRQLEQDMDRLLAELLGMPLQTMERWMRPGRYVSGSEVVQAGLAEMIDLKPLEAICSNGAPRRRRRPLARGARR
jgi:ATP-dependent Clp protease protease subunit